MENKRTCLYDKHVALGALISPFGGFDMPIQQSNIVDEHNAVRQACGMFDVSHMGEVLVTGEQSEEFVNYIFTNDVADAPKGKIYYGMMLHPTGGVVDDLLVYKMDEKKFFLVINAGNIDKDVAWIMEQAKNFNVTVEHQSDYYGEVAVQGPNAEAIIERVLGIPCAEMVFYTCKEIECNGETIIISRTGYTGEDGFEIYGSHAYTNEVWDKLVACGEVAPCGLGCRDTLRFEVGLPLYGDELTDEITPLEAGLGMFVKLEKGEDKIFTVYTEYNEYQAKTVIIAAGVKHKHLRTKSDRDDLVGKGVYYCAICDGPFYKGKEVAIIGDANTALQYSLLLSSYCKKVYVYTLFDKFFGDKAHVKALLSKENIEWRPNTSVTDFIGEDELTAFEYKDADGQLKVHEIPAVFVAIGQVPDNKAFAEYVDIDEMGYIISDENCKTKTEGLYVAGDCRTKPVRQVVTAVADGGIAATNASLYIDSWEE